MRERLEGKQYVEKYVQNLAHEMKSPLTAVIGAAEILEDELPAADRRKFADSIGEQARRLQAIIERMLMLARVEQLQTPEGGAVVELRSLRRAQGGIALVEHGRSRVAVGALGAAAHHRGGSSENDGERDAVCVALVLGVELREIVWAPAQELDLRTHHSYLP